MNKKQDNFFWSYFLQCDLRRNMKADFGRYSTYSVLNGISVKQHKTKLFLFNTLVKSYFEI